jgi:hypothetical protein
MHWIKFRTKVELIITAFIIVLLLAVSAASVTRIITDSQDNIHTFIRNSNGKYWEVTGSNLQTAINDLGNNGGTIWVGSDITLSSEIKLPHNNIIIDFEYHKVTLSEDISFINMSGGVYYSVVKNARIAVSNGHTEPVIYLLLPYNGGYPYEVSYNTFENIRIINPYGESNDDYIGIMLDIAVGVDSPNGLASFTYNTFRDITMFYPKTAILLQCNDCNAYGSANVFENIFVWNFETGVEFNIDSGASNLGFSETLFEHVKLQAAARSKDGFKSITGNGNHFDHCLIWDWNVVSSPNHEWSISDRAYYTYICADYIVDIIDDGYKTNVVNPI